MFNHNRNLFLIVSCCLCLFGKLQKFLKGKSVAYKKLICILSAARALSSPSQCFQLSKNLDKDLFRCLLC